MKKISTLLALALVFLPAITSAQEDGLGEISTFFEKIITFVGNTLTPLIFAVALLVFLYGIFKYFILGGADETRRKEGRQLMLYSVVGFVLMFSIFGIVSIITNGLGFSGSEEGSDLTLPKIPGG